MRLNGSKIWDLDATVQSWARDNFLASRQRNVAFGTSQGPEKNRKIVRPQCLEGVTTLFPDNIVTLSRQNCRVPSSATVYHTPFLFCVTFPGLRE